MPVFDILPEDEEALSHLGRIRLGVKNQAKNGKPENRPYFVLTNAPEVAKVYEENPTELLVYLPFSSIDENLRAWHESWVASACLCRGDGRHVWDRFSPKDGATKVVRRGQVIQTYTEDDGRTYERGGDTPKCPGLQHLFPRCKDCDLSTTLMMMVRDPKRKNANGIADQIVDDDWGYYDVVTKGFHNHTRLMKQLKGVLSLAKKMLGKDDLTGLPMILRRVPTDLWISLPNDKGGMSRQKSKQYLLDIRFDLAFAKRASARLYEAALEAPREQPGLFLPESIPDEAYQDAGADAVEGEYVEDAGEDDKPATVLATRPYTPEQFKERWLAALPSYEKKFGLGPADEKLRQAIVIKLNAMFEFEPDKHRHTFLNWLTGNDSAKALKNASAKLLMDIFADNACIKEVHGIIRQDALDKGQLELQL